MKYTCSYLHWLTTMLFVYQQLSLKLLLVTGKLCAVDATTGFNFYLSFLFNFFDLIIAYSEINMKNTLIISRNKLTGLSYWDTHMFWLHSLILISWESSLTFFKDNFIVQRWTNASSNAIFVWISDISIFFLQILKSYTRFETQTNASAHAYLNSLQKPIMKANLWLDRLLPSGNATLVWIQLNLSVETLRFTRCTLRQREINSNSLYCD